MRRGTRVGQAYVALTADGSGINEDIVDSVDAAGDDIGKSGDRAGQDYGDKFSERFRERLAKVREDVSQAFASRLAGNSSADALGERLGERIGAAVGDRLEASLAQQLDDLDEQVAARSVSGNRSTNAAQSNRAFPSRDPDDAVWVRAHEADKAFDRARRLMLDRAGQMNEQFDRARGLMVERAIQMDEQITRAQGLMVERAHAMNEQFDRQRGLMVERAQAMNEKFDRAQGLMVEQAIRMNEKFDRQRGLLIDRAYQMDEDRTQRLGRMQEQAIRLNRDRDERIFKMDSERIQRLGRMQEAALRLNEQYNSGRLGGDGRLIPGGGTRPGSGSLFDGDTIGKLFGAGSRNNALNLMGKTVGGLIKGMARLGKVASSTVSTFTKGMADAGQGASKMARLTAGAGAVGSKAMASLAASGPAVAVAIGVVIIAASSLVSILGALLAIVTALTATIVSALTGALVVLGGALAAVAAAGGLLTIAFTSMTDAQTKALKTAFRPLKEELTGIGQIMMQEMVPAFSQWSANLQRALLPLAPLAHQMGGAFAEAGNALTASFGGEGFQRFAAALGVHLPGIVTRLSAALGSFLNGLTGTFAALMPMINRFAGYLQETAARFANWANSVQGQNSIVDFTERAVDSLQSLWNFTREFFGWLGDILFSSEAQAAGNNMFDSLANSFAGLRENIADGSLEKWFADAIEFGGQLWAVMTSLGDTIAHLYNSGMLEAMGTGFATFASAVDAVNVILGPLIDTLGYALPLAMAAAMAPLQGVALAVIAIGEAIEAVGGLLNKITPGSFFGDGGEMDPIKDLVNNVAGQWTSAVSGNGSSGGGLFSGMTGAVSGLIKGIMDKGKSALPPGGGYTLPGLTSSGNSALQATAAEYQNPYKDWAKSLEKDGPTVAKQIRQSVRSVNREIANALRQASKAETAGEVKSIMTSTMKAIRSSAEQAVSIAESSLNSAAANLASADSQSETRKALAQVRLSQANLRQAERAQKRIGQMAKRLAKQRVVTPTRVNRLLEGKNAPRATLADYARARERIAVQIEAANERLVDAIAMRDDYKASVTDATKSFGNLLTAQAQTIDGVEQALTHTDITTNLQDRLKQITDFQNNLRILLAQGLSNDAYKQLVDGGVESGGAYAEALVAGGSGAVSQVNDLTKKINDAAASLGGQASTRLYQAGVDAAKGLVDGLTSLSAQLDSAAARLGNSIAAAVKRSLGIRSPSTVMFDAMDDVGDGIVDGLDAQHSKVGLASSRLSTKVAVSPEVAQYAAQQGTAPTVSGNQTTHQWHITTPTEDPEAVAREMMNEMTGRL